MRIFWDMQQNQEIHKDANWQDIHRYALNDILINEQERKKEC